MLRPLGSCLYSTLPPLLRPRLCTWKGRFNKMGAPILAVWMISCFPSAFLFIQRLEQQKPGLFWGTARRRWPGVTGLPQNLVGQMEVLFNLTPFRESRAGCLIISILFKNQGNENPGKNLFSRGSAKLDHAEILAATLSTGVEQKSMSRIASNWFPCNKMGKGLLLHQVCLASL